MVSLMAELYAVAKNNRPLADRTLADARNFRLSLYRIFSAIASGKHPERLDLHDEHISWARRHGVKFAIDTDAHAAPHLAMIRFGLWQARRGWLEPDDVINTWPLSRLRKFLASSGGSR